jgi:hypothetical protein
VILSQGGIDMKKIMILAAAAAAIFGLTKLRGKKEDADFGSDTPATTNGYAPQPQQ